MSDDSSQPLPTMSNVAAHLTVHLSPKQVRRVEAWQEWQKREAETNPWRADVAKLSTLLSGAVLAGIEIQDDLDTPFAAFDRGTVFVFVLPTSRRVSLHVSISSADNEKPDCSSADEEDFQNLLYDNRLGLKVDTFNREPYSSPQDPIDWDSAEWRLIPAHDRDFVDSYVDPDSDEE